MAKTVNSYTMIEMVEWKEENETHDLEEPFDENFWLTVRSEVRSTFSVGTKNYKHLQNWPLRQEKEHIEF